MQDSQEIPYNMAVIYEAQGRYDEAIQTIQQLLQKSEKPDAAYTASDKTQSLDLPGTAGQHLSRVEPYAAGD